MEKQLDEFESEQFSTKRAVSAGIEKFLYKPIPVLDKGFIRVID